MRRLLRVDGRSELKRDRPAYTIYSYYTWYVRTTIFCLFVDCSEVLSITSDLPIESTPSARPAAVATTTRPAQGLVEKNPEKRPGPDPPRVPWPRPLLTCLHEASPCSIAYCTEIPKSVPDGVPAAINFLGSFFVRDGVCTGYERTAAVLQHTAAAVRSLYLRCWYSYIHNRYLYAKFRQ